MSKRLLGIVALIGIVIFAVALWLNSTLNATGASASKLDKRDVKQGMVIGEPLCAWVAEITDRVMSENETRALMVRADNKTDESCKSMVRLVSPGFSVNPREEEQTLAVPAGRSGSLAWVLTPNKTGSFEIIVTDDLTTQSLGLQVTDVLGFTVEQAKLLSWLGSVLGPMCTFPWWVEKWLQRRKRISDKPLPNPKDGDNSGPKN
jgi:hypothetical protein